MGQNSKTRAWELYEKGRQYNNSLVPNQYRLVNTNIEFFAGNQWINVPMTPAMSRLPKPVFNIIKRVASLFVASLTSSGTTIHFEPLSYYDGENQKDPENNAAEYATAEVENLLEKFKFEYKIREALFDGAQTRRLRGALLVGRGCAAVWRRVRRAPGRNSDGACRRDQHHVWQSERFPRGDTALYPCHWQRYR